MLTEEQKAKLKAIRIPRSGPRAQRQSQFKNVTWNTTTQRWQVSIGIRGKLFCVSAHKPGDLAEQEAANNADMARWFLQDFLPRAPKYNFPDQLPPNDLIPFRIANIRIQLLELGLPRFEPHHPEFKPSDYTIECLNAINFSRPRPGDPPPLYIPLAQRKPEAPKCVNCGCSGLELVKFQDYDFCRPCAEQEKAAQDYLAAQRAASAQ